MSAETLPGELLKRRAIVYVRQSSPTQVQTNLESQRRQYDLVELAKRPDFLTSRSSTMTSIAQPAVVSRDRGSRGWWLRFARGRSAPCCALMHHDCRAMDAIGIICSSCVVSSAHG